MKDKFIDTLAKCMFSLVISIFLVAVVVIAILVFGFIGFTNFMPWYFAVEFESYFIGFGAVVINIFTLLMIGLDEID